MPQTPKHLFTVLIAPVVDDDEDMDASQVDPDLPVTVISSDPEALLDARDAHQK